MIDGETRIGIFATRDIKKGEHLTYDYQYDPLLIFTAIHVLSSFVFVYFLGCINFLNIFIWSSEVRHETYMTITTAIYSRQCCLLPPV